MCMNIDMDMDMDRLCFRDIDAGVGSVKCVDGGRSKLAVDRRGLDWIGIGGGGDQCLGGEAVRVRE